MRMMEISNDDDGLHHRYSISSSSSFDISIIVIRYLHYRQMEILNDDVIDIE